MLQTSSSTSSPKACPAQFLPAPAGVGLVQERDRVRMPLPQVLEQDPQLDHAVKSPLTKIEVFR